MRTVPAIAEGIAVAPGLAGENVPVTGWTCPISLV
jgi:hypothetical protein